MRVAVTGATGNIGAALLPRLAAMPDVDEIVGIARRTPDWDVPKVRWESSAIEEDDLAGPLRGVDALVHLVWIIQPSRDTERQRIVNIVGLERVLAAATAAGVRSIVHASSVGAYSPGPRDRLVDESWPTDGTSRLPYSWQKAYAERLLDRYERDRSDVRVVRIRPALVMQRAAGTEVKRYFLGRLVPRFAVRPTPLLALLDHGPLQLQAVHTDDVATAFAAATVSDVRGPLNVAAPDVVGVDRRVGLAIVSRLAGATFTARLQPTGAGWVDAAGHLPLMDTGRIASELGWKAETSARDALSELLGGMRDRATGPTPALT
jgi:nucleoside-diphosphate-sugar epimerase